MAWRTYWGEALGVTLLVMIIASDIVLALDGRPGNTYSERIVELGSRMIVVPLAIGIIAGHWCLPSTLPRVQGGLGILIAICVLTALLDWRTGHALSRQVQPIVWLLAGLPMGSLLWSMPLPVR